MRAGIIAEGKGDMGVITNILKGVLDIDRSDITYLVPELEYDETDLSQMRPEQFSNWTIVKKHCEDGKVIGNFFEAIEDERFMVVHIDTAERMEKGYDVVTPDRSASNDYVDWVRTNVVSKIKEWLSSNHNDRITFAVAVEETEAWLLTILDDKTETGLFPDPKKRFERLFNQKTNDKDKKQIFQLEAFDQGFEKSRLFRKTKELKASRNKNRSLELFCAELENLGTP